MVGLSELISSAIGSVSNLVSEFITDKDKKNELDNKIKVIELEAQRQILEMEHKEKIEQLSVAKIEASSNDAYVRRARPTILWICGVGMAYSFLLHPIFCWGLTVATIWIPEAANITPPPNLSMSEMFPILLGMLGLSGYRTVEKIKGVNGK